MPKVSHWEFVRRFQDVHLARAPKTHCVTGFHPFLSPVFLFYERNGSPRDLSSAVTPSATQAPSSKRTRPKIDKGPRRRRRRVGVRAIVLPFRDIVVSVVTVVAMQTAETRIYAAMEIQESREFIQSLAVFFSLSLFPCPEEVREP